MADLLGDLLALLLSDGVALLLSLEAGDLPWNLLAVLSGHSLALLPGHLRTGSFTLGKLILVISCSTERISHN